MALYPNITEDFDPKALHRRLVQAESAPYADTAAEEEFEDRSETVTLLGAGRKVKSKYVRCPQCRLRYIYGQGHRGSAYCFMMQNVVWAYANELWPLDCSDAIVDMLNKASCRYELLWTGKQRERVSEWDPSSQKWYRRASYNDVTSLSRRLWVESSVAFALYREVNFFMPTVTQKLKDGWRLVPGSPGAPDCRMWSKEMAAYFAALRPELGQRPPHVPPELIRRPNTR